MTKLDMVREAWRQLGDATADALAAFVETTFGSRIEPKFIPVFKASIREKHRLDALRLAARAAVAKDRTEAPTPGKALPISQRAADARQLALQLMAAHGLHAWAFTFNRRKQALGLCVYGRRSIELSIHFVERDNPPEEIRDTILHEIAHALVGPGHGHDKVWKRKCIEIGARPQRCGQADMPEGNWRARCGSCGKCFHRYKKPKRHGGWFCRDCGCERGRLVWKQNGCA